MNKTIVLVLVIILVIVGGYFLVNRDTNQSPADSPVAGAGEHCGGNRLNARACPDGYHCAPEPGSNLPFGDVGGICVAD